MYLADIETTSESPSAEIRKNIELFSNYGFSEFGNLEEEIYSFLGSDYINEAQLKVVIGQKFQLFHDRVLVQRYHESWGYFQNNFNGDIHIFAIEHRDAFIANVRNINLHDANDSLLVLRQLDEEIIADEVIYSPS